MMVSQGVPLDDFMFCDYIAFVFQAFPLHPQILKKDDGLGVVESLFPWCGGTRRCPAVVLTGNRAGNWNFERMYLWPNQWLHSLELIWKWNRAPWKTIFLYVKQLFFHCHVRSRSFLDSLSGVRTRWKEIRIVGAAKHSQGVLVSKQGTTFQPRT